MEQSGYPSSAMVDSSNMPMPIYTTPPDQAILLSPDERYLYPQSPWSGWNNDMAENIYTQGGSAAPMDSSVHWQQQRQNDLSHKHQTAPGTASDYAVAGWVPQSDQWPRYQQHHFAPTQPALYSPPTQWPTPACSPPAMMRGWQAPPHQHSPWRAEPEPMAVPSPMVKVTEANNRMPGGQQPAKRAKIGPTGKPSPASSSSYDDSNQWAEEDHEDEGRGVQSDEVPRPDRKKTYRVKNRAAAKRCREKTKQYEIDLAAKEKEVTRERIYLDACVAALKNEVLTLKNQILQHGDCNCEIIQGYIARAANNAAHPTYSPPESMA
ncbi:Cyclic AMP-responsive element-binding protein 5 [Colletotrichum trifolii]|uniref:Cyclic AMP-responsive element-binding protein 5 n=1 Tax=Colletotrichum trifolii TaxID=5466 RepID=A0A4R8QV98_COLTR|nr:Cyclic AMP-responsive element-binding protein 5 [Colletotrichum trifolii]